MKDLMIDLETLDTESDAVVLSIGAVFFDTVFGRMGERFEVNLDVQEQLDIGRKISWKTLRWWMTQSPQARQVFSADRINVEDSLATLYGWIGAHQVDDNVRVWGNGSDFDIGILKHIFNQFQMPLPWKYNNVRDLRTFKEHVAKNAPIEKIGTAHNALDDAISQAAYVIKYTRLGRPNE